MILMIKFYKFNQMLIKLLTKFQKCKISLSKD
jgi:hypothetical protein